MVPHYKRRKPPLSLLIDLLHCCLQINLPLIEIPFAFTSLPYCSLFDADRAVQLPSSISKSHLGSCLTVPDHTQGIYISSFESSFDLKRKRQFGFFPISRESDASLNYTKPKRKPEKLIYYTSLSCPNPFETYLSTIIKIVYVSPT